jgi:hypothetical protein
MQDLYSSKIILWKFSIIYESGILGVKAFPLSPDYGPPLQVKWSFPYKRLVSIFDLNISLVHYDFDTRVYEKTYYFYFITRLRWLQSKHYYKYVQNELTKKHIRHMMKKRKICDREIKIVCFFVNACVKVIMNKRITWQRDKYSYL